MSYLALAYPRLLGIQDTKSKGATSLVLASLPGYQEGPSVPFDVASDAAPANRKTDPFVSSDRRVIAYAAGRWIACRRSNDLSLVWSRQIESGMDGVRSLSLTPDGTRIAAAVMDNFAIDFQKSPYIDILAGEDGALITRLPLNGFECIAISPNGNLLAVGRRIRLRFGQMQPTVNLYDITSGRQVGSVIHDRLRVSRNNFGDDEISCAFTPDGKYLITSSIHVKVWSLSE